MPIHLTSKSASHKVSPASKRGLKILLPDALMRPLAYIVCTSPRTGSTLLCQGLSHSGRAGAPAEFFDHRTEVEEYWRRRYGIDREIGLCLGNNCGDKHFEWSVRNQAALVHLARHVSRASWRSGFSFRGPSRRILERPLASTLLDSSVCMVASAQ